MNSLAYVNINLGLFSSLEAKSSWILLAMALVVGPLARALPSNSFTYNSSFPSGNGLALFFWIYLCVC